MTAWVRLLGGLIIWTVHFFGAYIIASVFPGTDLARWLVLALTVLCVGLASLILVVLIRAQRSQSDPLDRWASTLAAMGHGIAIAAIGYQAVPAVLG